VEPELRSTQEGVAPSTHVHLPVEDPCRRRRVLDERIRANQKKTAPRGGRPIYECPRVKKFDGIASGRLAAPAP
jgi:hypothetical protein